MLNVQLDKQYDLFINGEFIESKNYFEAVNPATGAVLAKVSTGSNKDVDRAVQAARKTFTSWKRTSIEKRSHYLHQIADVLEENKERLIKIDCLEVGRPISEIGKDYEIAIGQFRYFASAILDLSGSSRPISNGQLIVQKEPFGVCAQIIPWNVPMIILSYKIAPAIVTGNTVVLKPSTDASLGSMEFAKLIQAILPAGVVNIVTGSGSETGEALINHPDVDKLAFTGSTAMGRKIGKKAGEKLIPVTLELGGKSPHIVFPDVDNIVKAVEEVVFGFSAYNGQGCLNGTRLFIHDDIYEEFMEHLIMQVQSLKVGDPAEPETNISAVISQKQGEKILEYIAIGIKEKANLITGGKRVQVPGNEYGYFIEPTIFEATNDMTIAQEEIFGPVLVVISWNDYDQMIKEANDVHYGLSAGIITNNLKNAIKTAQRIEAGNIWVNQYNNFQTGAPFGGYKASGLGREFGKEALDMYTQSKMITFVNELT